MLTCAGALITIAPIVLVFLLLQRYVIDGIAGAVKERSQQGHCQCRSLHSSGTIDEIYALVDALLAEHGAFIPALAL